MIAVLPDKWCIDSAKFSASYHANKIYLGVRNNLERETFVTLEWVFDSKAEQRNFFHDFWQLGTDSGGLPFYAKLPLFAEDDFYLLIQVKPFVQSVYPEYKISGQFKLFMNKTKRMISAPVASDVHAYVEQGSSNNIIMLQVTDPNGGAIQNMQFVGLHPGAVIKGNSVLFTPSPGFKGIKHFRYRANNGVKWSNNAALVIDVAAVGAPVANDVSVTVAEKSTPESPREVTLSGYDPAGKPLTYEIMSQGNNGEVVEYRQVFDGIGGYLDDTKSGIVYVKPGTANTFSFNYRVDNGVHKSTVKKCTVKVVPAKAFQVFIERATLFAPCTGSQDKPVTLELPNTTPDGVPLSYTVHHISGAGTQKIEDNMTLVVPGELKVPYYRLVMRTPLTATGRVKFKVTATNGIQSHDMTIENDIDAKSTDRSYLYRDITRLTYNLQRDDSNSEVYMTIPFAAIPAEYKTTESYHTASTITQPCQTTEWVVVAAFKKLVSTGNYEVHMLHGNTIRLVKKGATWGDHVEFIITMSNCDGSKSHDIPVDVYFI